MVVLETTLTNLIEQIGKKVTIEELSSALDQIGFELENHEQGQLKVEITPDRIDALSTAGLARILRAFFGLKEKMYHASNSSYKVIVEPSVEKVRPFTACAVVKGVHFTDEKIKNIIWVQEKLHATFGKHRKKSGAGVYPLSNIRWPIRYCAKKPEEINFTPLNSHKEMTATQILTQHSTGKEFAHLLQNAPVYPLFIDADNIILSMPPIINSQTLGKVTTDTKDIFIECTGLDMQAQMQFLNLLVCIFIDMGGEVFAVDVVYGKKKVTTPNLSYEHRSISSAFVEQIVGVSIPSKKIGTLLTQMGHKVRTVTKSHVNFSVPPYRLDIWHDVDIVDDIVRAYGVNNIAEEVPRVATISKTLFENRLQFIIADMLTNLGFVEIKTLAVTDKRHQFDMMNQQPINHVALGDCAEKTINMLRFWLLPETIKFLHNNRSNTYPQYIFEVGDVVIPDESADVRSKNQTKIACAICKDTATFTDIKQTLEAVATSLGVSLSYTATENGAFIKGRCASVILNGKNIGLIGEINPIVLNNWSMEYPIAAFEIDLQSIVDVIQPKNKKK